MAAQCPVNTAMVSWRFVADARPWYDREDGAYTLSPTCCSVGEAGLGLCTKRLSGCAVPKQGVLEGAQGDGHNRNSEVGRCRLTPGRPWACRDWFPR